MRNLIFILLTLVTVGQAMAAQTSTSEIDFPYDSTIIIGTVGEIKKDRSSQLKIDTIYGTPTITTYKVDPKTGGVEQSDLPIKIGLFLDIDLTSDSSFDEDGNPLVLLQVSGEIDLTTVKQNDEIIYIPNGFHFFKKTDELIKKIEAKTKEKMAAPTN